MSFTKADVAAIMSKHAVEDLSAKIVRVKLEEQLGLEPGSLKSEKARISDLIDEVLNEDSKAADADEAEDDDDEEEEEEKPKSKKAKTSKAANDANENKGKAKCETRTGAEAPKNIKKMQETMKMTAKKFMDNAKAVEFGVHGNTLRGEPRSFSSGAFGWYLGGKIEMDVGGETVWAQLGCNIVIPGSNAWKR